MTKREAIKAMTDGKRVKRSHWGDNEYLYMDDEGNILNTATCFYEMNHKRVDEWLLCDKVEGAEHE